MLQRLWIPAFAGMTMVDDFRSSPASGRGSSAAQHYSDRYKILSFTATLPSIARE